jgi:F0F1-type ATP synthase assembly protein I
VADPPRRAPIAEALRYAQAGSMIVAPMLGLGAAGYYLDRRWGTKPWLLLAGLIAGMIGGFVSFFRLVLPPGGRGPGAGRT